ncbi:MAG: helix-turn-helix transcriptional regulator [Actinomycetes bacterium]
MTTSDAIAQAIARRDLPDPAGRRHLRECSGLSQRSVGMYIGTSAQAIANYEMGKRSPRGSTLVRYSELLTQLACILEDG